jgi:hypothetical protein
VIRQQVVFFKNFFIEKKWYNTGSAAIIERKSIIPCFGVILKTFYNRKIIWAAALAVSILTVVVYLPGLNNDFVNLDDHRYIYHNQNIHSFKFTNIAWMFTVFHASNWHPLAWISHALDYAVWGLNPTGHHLSSIILHGLNTFLVVIICFLFIDYGKKSKETTFLQDNKEGFSKTALTGAVLTGLFFGLHPLHVESVAWVSERKDVLCAFFYLLSILMYVQYVKSRTQRKKLYSFCILLFTLSLMSKPMAVSFPFVLIILDFYPLQRLSFKHALTKERLVLLEKVPFVLLSAISSILTIAAQRSGGGLKSLILHPFEDRILVALRALGFYLYKIFWPTGLVPLYPYPLEISFLNAQVIGSFTLVTAITVICILQWKTRRVFAATWTYYAVTLFPVLGLIQVGPQAAADRYMYLPSLGPFILVALACVVLYEKVRAKISSPRLIKACGLFLCLLITCTLSFLTIQQIKIWKNSTILWKTEIEQFPERFQHHMKTMKSRKK